MLVLQKKLGSNSLEFVNGAWTTQAGSLENGVQYKAKGGVSGLYWLDPGLIGSPFKCYCNMDDIDGGWMLFVNHKDNLSRSVASPPEPSVYGYQNDANWIRLKTQATVGGMFKDEYNNISTLSLSKWQAANVVNFNSVTTLNQISLFHDEISGTDIKGSDYSLIRYAQVNATSDAALYQLSTIKFDIWPYVSQEFSFNEHSELEYYLK